MEKWEFRQQYLGGPSRVDVRFFIEQVRSDLQCLMLEVRRYDDADRIIETDVDVAGMWPGLPTALGPQQPAAQTYLKAAADTVQKLRSNSYLGSIAGTAKFAARRGLSAVLPQWGSAPLEQPTYLMNFSAHVTSADKIRSSRLAELLFHGHRDSATTIMRHTDDDGKTFELRVCGKEDNAYFEWIDDLGDPIVSAFDVIDGDPELQAFNLHKDLALIHQGDWSKPDEPAPAP